MTYTYSIILLGLFVLISFSCSSKAQCSGYDCNAESMRTTSINFARDPNAIDATCSLVCPSGRRRIYLNIKMDRSTFREASCSIMSNYCGDCQNLVRFASQEDLKIYNRQYKAMCQDVRRLPNSFLERIKR